MSNKLEIGDLAGLSKPMERLIEKISDAVGAISKPWQIRRVAEAEADAMTVKALANLNIAEVQRRAAHRFIQEETKKQLNIENVTYKALPLLLQTSDPGKINNDWLMNFFDKCKIISDDDVQGLWGKVLAGEANNPGTYSRRTINIMSAMSKEDAILFTTICRFIWKVGDSTIPLVVDYKNEIYNSEGLNFGSLTYLQEIGLINYSPVGLNYSCFEKSVDVEYHTRKLRINFPASSETSNSLRVGSVFLSNAGEQVSRVCEASEPIEGFFDYAKNYWSQKGLQAVII